MKSLSTVKRFLKKLGRMDMILIVFPALWLLMMEELSPIMMQDAVMVIVQRRHFFTVGVTTVE
jgi:hypothetical protein